MAVLSVLTLPRAADAETIFFNFDPAFDYTLTLRSTLGVNFGTGLNPPSSSTVTGTASLGVMLSPAVVFAVLSVQHTVNGSTVPGDISTTFGVDATDSGTIGVSSSSS